jgi:hypothetical protein
MSFGENQKGKTFAFATFSPFSSTFQQLKEILVLLKAHAPELQAAVKERKFLHYANFSRITPKQLRRLGLPTDGTLRFGAFIFNSAYNGDAEVYFRGFSENLTQPMDALWRGNIGWVSAFPYPNLRKFIRRYQRQVTCHVNAYPSFATEVRTAMEVRNEVDRLMADAVTMDDAQFEKAFGEATMKLWGNAS